MARFKYLALILTTGLAVAAIFILGQRQNQEQGTEKAAAAEVSRLLDVVTAAFEQYSERLATELTRVIEAELTTNEATSWLINSSFEAVALAEPDTLGGWSLEWVKSPGQGQQSFDFSSWLPQLSKDAVQDNRFVFQTVLNIRKEPRVLFGVQLRVKSNGADVTKIGLGVLPVTEVAGILSSVKGAELEAFVVDKEGNALTYPDPRYVGSRMDIHPIVAALSNSAGSRNISAFTNLLQKPTVGGFKKLPKSGAAVVVNIPTEVAASGKKDLITLLVLACALTLVLSVLGYALSSNDQHTIRSLKERAAYMQAQLKNLQGEARQFETVSAAHRHWSRSVSGYLRSPVYSLLGEVQKLKEKYKAGSALAFLEDELRKIKDFVESLSSRASDTNAEQTFSVNEKLSESIYRQKESFDRRGVDLQFVGDKNAIIYGNISDFQTAIDLLFQYILKELGPATSAKEIRTDLTAEHGTVEIKLSVPIVGLPDDLIEVMSMQTDRHVGLAVANGLFKTIGGSLSVESNMSGSLVKIRFPMAASTRASESGQQTEGLSHSKPQTEPSIEAPKKSNRLETALLTKKVTEELDKILPPEPHKTEKHDVSVVDELTASIDLTEPKVKIRKPRVRYDT